jgi:hypothetical protein
LKLAHFGVATGLFFAIGCTGDTPVNPDMGHDSPTLFDATTAMAKAGGAAISLDGADDYVEIPDHPSLDLTDAFTIAAWVFLDSYTEWASVVTKGGFAGCLDLCSNNYTIHQSGPVGGSDHGRLRFTGSSPALPRYLESNTQIPLGEWHYIAVAYDGTTLRFYLDGEPDGGGPLPGPLVGNDEPLNIGADFPGGDEYWQGRIDELRIWNRSVKEAHLRAAMNGHASPDASGLAGYWRFDEGIGDSVADRSLEKNDGQLVNGPTWITPGAPLGNAGQ